jgi:N-acetylmuramoyl-L-alanine amidase
MWTTKGAFAAVLAVGLAPCTEGSAAPRPVLERPFVVVLDPGHGGSNAGCRGHEGHHEKEVTLELAREVEARLREVLPHAQVTLTRTGDETMTLAERVAFANRRGADLFVSLHANASPDRRQEGFETYVLDTEATGREAAQIARRENEGSARLPEGDDPVARMLREATVVHHRFAALRFARELQEQQASRFPARTDRGVKQAPFDVLMGASMPAVLFEMGFLDHAGEGPVIASAAGRRAVADGLTQAIATYYTTVVRRQ